MNKPMILVVEDDRAVRKLITTTLETQGYHYEAAETGEASILAAVTRQPDVIILDLGLPDMDGMDIIKKVRAFANTPIIVVSARSDDKDKTGALDAGADDYLTKPFSVEEFLARLRVALRRVRTDSEKLQKEATTFQNGPLTIDYAAGCACLNGEEVHLTPIEYKLLCLLAKNVGKVLTHNTILHEVWGEYGGDVSALRVFMATLRRKIGAGAASGATASSAAGNARQQMIQTHIGVGYRMLRVSDDSKPD